MSRHFTHLHLHTDYSLLDGAISIEKLIKFGVEQQVKALAITDHGNIFGAVKFFQAAQKAKIKPILGMEAYFTEHISIKQANNKYYHLIILVENEIGYKNLCKLISYSYQEGFYFKPRIDYALLKQHAEGLIVTSACLGGHIPSLLMQDNIAEAETRIDWFLDVFGPDRFYLEVQPEDTAAQKKLNKKIFEIGLRKGIKIVATGDCHYPTREDHEAHEVMLAIQTHHKMADPDRFTFGEFRAYIRTQEEMLAIFQDHPEAVWQSGEIADRCSFNFTTDKLFFPSFPLPEETTISDYFKSLCYQGFDNLLTSKRIPQDQHDAYQKRLAVEIDLITKTGFIGYFLVVSDFIQWAKKNTIPVGPGRGSVAGSLTAWTLQITDIDPIKYNLLFERFLNPERISMPDIDIDFCIEGRDKVINYVRERYGHDHVCQIITFGTMLAKGAIKDVARALGFPFEDSNALTNLIPDQLKITLKEACEQEPKINELIASNKNVAKLFDLAFRLEGITRHASKHAAGIVITPEPVINMLPVYIPPKTTDLVTQYAMTELESLGFLKIDFLGLKNLTLIQKAVASITANHHIDLDISSLPLDDPKTFTLLCRGDTSGVFQLESSGLKEVLRKLQPEKFEDIIAVNALYRPGPLGSGMVDDFIERKHGRQKVVYLFPELTEILQETYGTIVYQEQVMKIASAVAGFSLGESDILRRAMGKKKADVMAEQKSIFVRKAVERNFDAKKSEELFDLMAYFAGYGFNKSHSAAYALIAYQTAYLKANFPAEFMACLISLEAGDAEKMSFYLEDAKKMAIPILAPNINTSQFAFSVVDGAILFGLQGIKNVGQAALDEIISQRTIPFSDLFDFCCRVDTRVINKRVIESLICAGAFDALPGNRAQKMHSLPDIIDQATVLRQEKKTGQMGLFATFASTSNNGTHVSQQFQFPDLAEWESSVKLSKEKEVLGVYMSGQPLDRYASYIATLPVQSLANIQQSRSLVTTYGLVTHTKTVVTKKGAPMAFLTLEAHGRSAEVVIFPKLYDRVQSWLTQYNAFMVTGTSEESSEQVCKIKASDIIPIDIMMNTGQGISAIHIILPAEPDPMALQAIKENFIPGSLPLTFIFFENGKQLQLTSKIKIGYSPQLLEQVQQYHLRIKFLL